MKQPKSFSINNSFSKIFVYFLIVFLPLAGIYFWKVRQKSSTLNYINVMVCPFPRDNNKACIEGKEVADKYSHNITEFQLNNGTKIEVQSCEFEDYWGKCRDFEGKQWEIINIDLKKLLEESSPLSN